MLKKGDYFIIGIIIMIAAAFFLGTRVFKNHYTDMPMVAIIMQDGKKIENIILDAVDEPREIILDGKYSNTILVEKGRIRFKESNCPDKICVNAGWLSKRGDTAVCMPNKAVIVIEGGRGDDTVDIVTN
ncbi:MAG: NusG domain II-containing protein [Clostridium sp.]|nr:NusG domain II-containing protein [Clostridium sp.]